ncbi:MAG TPA: SRPBCC family protein [Solirubrobacteraceae bacterium]|nr:SRPBCC family protein [Solirubrobacteraceae bacterium]
MANDIQDRIGQIFGSDSARALAGTAVTEALKALGGQRSSNGSEDQGSRSGGGLKGMRGLAAGAGAAAVAPMAAKGIGKLIKGNGAGALTDGPKKLAEQATSKLGDTVEGKLKEKVEDAGGPAGILKDTVKGALPFGGGGGGGGKQDAEGVGKGRRMPIQQSMDIGLPVETVYNQWTQFEDWPKFMHRVTRASQEDPCKVNFAVKIWGKTKEFTADIETQRPNDRIKWKTTQGMNHSGVVVFRELGPNLTRVILSFDLAPGGLLEKYARGARYVKRAARADMHRFAAFIEMLENETGAWRGVIEDGELVEDHDPSYDEEREYGDPEELVHGRGSEEDEDDDDEDSDDDDSEDEASERNGGEPRAREARSSGSRKSGRARQSAGSSRAQSRSGSASRSTGSRSSSGNGRSSRSTSGRSSSGSGSRGRSSTASSGRSSKKSTSGRSSSSGASKSSGRSNGGSRSSASGSSRSSSGGRTSGRTRSGRGSQSSRSSSSAHQGRQRSRSSRRS